MNEKNIHPEAIDDEAMDSVTGGILGNDAGDLVKNFNPFPNGIPDGMRVGKKQYKSSPEAQEKSQQQLDYAMSIIEKYNKGR